MKLIQLLLPGVLMISLSACAQKKDKSTPTTTQNLIKMDTSKLTNTAVKAAFDAWQKGDAQTFTSYFTADAKLFDDGNPRDFGRFVKDACGHEKFVSIDKVENNGFDIYGKFHTESWGDFNTYFKFHLAADGKFNRLDIGQAN